MKTVLLRFLMIVSVAAGLTAGHQVMFAAKEKVAECGCKSECKCDPCRCAYPNRE